MSDTKQDVGTYGERFGDEFQLHILAVAARKPEFLNSYRTAFDDGFFSRKLGQLLAKALTAHFDKYKALPTRVTLFEEAKELCSEDHLPNLSDMLEALYGDDISDASAVMDKAVEFGRHQALINAVIESAGEIQKGNTDKVMPLVQQALMVGEDVQDLGLNYGDPNHPRYDSYLTYDGDGDRIPTGIVHLDRVMGGGLGRGELGVILGPPKRGKSTVLINIAFGAAAALEGYVVVYYTLEMSPREVSIRLDDRMAGAMVKLKHENRVKYCEALKDRNRRLLHGDLYIQGYRTRQASVDTLRSHLNILAAREIRPDLIIIDYGDILKPQRRLGEHRHEQAGIYEDMRALGQEFNAGVWSACQGNRDSVDKPLLTITDAAESFEKTAIADAFIPLCQTPEEAEQQKCRLFAAALRRAEGSKMIECDFMRDRCLIRSNMVLTASGYPLLSETEKEDFAERGVKPEDVQKRYEKTLSKGKRSTKGKKKKAQSPSRKVRKSLRGDS